MTISQNRRLLAHLRRGKRVTPMDALREFGCFRLGARMWDLRRAGHPIHRRMVEIDGRKRVAEYWLSR